MNTQTTQRDRQSQGYIKAVEYVRSFFKSDEVPTLSSGATSGTEPNGRPEAWFLGPKAENLQIFERLVIDALRDQAYWRRNFHPGDPIHITEEVKRSPGYLAGLDALYEGHRELLSFLKKSVPFFSMRYQGHMNWETTLPGQIGYFSAMLYNPNNVAFEGSTATTILEIIVGNDLCRMLGYKIPGLDKGIPENAVRPWGHITCDGTVANIEAIWAARNLKFYPLAFQAALQESKVLAKAKDMQILLPAGGSGLIRELTSWELLNLRADDILALPTRLSEEFQIPREAVTDALGAFSLQNMGIQAFASRFLGEFKKPPVFLVSGTKHYSFPKAAAILGLGASNMIDVPVDLDARMSEKALAKLLWEFQADRRPVIAVVAVMGTTEESAVDPLRKVLDIRTAGRKRGFEFLVHADAAWGGYHASLIRDDFDMERPQFQGPAIPVGMSDYATEQFAALAESDSITVDPHKSGYIPYPAGALCYRNSAMRDLVTFAAPVVFHGDAEPTVGIYGVEGSKPGAAAAAVYLSHRVIRPTKSGYGQIIGQAMFTCKMLYFHLLCMDDPRVVVQPLPRLPSERDGGDVNGELRFIREHILGKTNDQIRSLPDVYRRLAEYGPDQNILAYAFNFRTLAGTLNSDLRLANRFNRALYDRLSINPGEDIYSYGLVVSTTDLHSTQYGTDFIDDYKRRLGVGESEGEMVTVLRSVTMDPWVTDTASGSFLNTIIAEFKKAVGHALEAVEPGRMRGY